MIAKRHVALNVIWNWAGMAVTILGGFVVSPFLVAHLGRTGYGLWILVASVSGYFGLLDLGMRGSVGRNMAYQRALGNSDGVNAMLSTALALLSVPAALTLLGSGGLVFLFDRCFEVPPEQLTAVRWALVLTGVNLAVSISLNVFDAALWSVQRFDLINAVDIPVCLVRVSLTFLLVDAENGLIALAMITLLATILAVAAKAVLSFHAERSLRLGVDLVGSDAARGLLGFGVWSWLLSVSRMVSSQCGPFLIGSRLGVALVTPYNIAARLTGFAQALLVAASGVLTPLATALHATDQNQRQRQLVLDGGKCCLALALFFLAAFLLLGRPFIRLWMGPDLDTAYPLLVILALGEVLPLSQCVGFGMILGMGRHSILACASLVENAAVIGLAVALGDYFGLVGVCVAVAVPGFCNRGVFQMSFICRAVELPLSSYLRTAVAPALAVAVLPTTGLLLLTESCPVTSWLDLIVYTGGFSVAYAVSAAMFLGYRGLLLDLRHGGLSDPPDSSNPEPECNGDERPCPAPAGHVSSSTEGIWQPAGRA